MSEHNWKIVDWDVKNQLKQAQISSLQGSALRMLVESLGKPRDVNKHSQTCGQLLNGAKGLDFCLSLYVYVWVHSSLWQAYIDAYAHLILHLSHMQ